MVVVVVVIAAVVEFVYMLIFLFLSLLFCYNRGCILLIRVLQEARVCEGFTGVCQGLVQGM